MFWFKRLIKFFYLKSEVNKEKPDPGVERVADLVNKALNVAELILKVGDLK